MESKGVVMIVPEEIPRHDIQLDNEEDSGYCQNPNCGNQVKRPGLCKSCADADRYDNREDR